MERKGWESIGWSDVKHNHYVTLRQRILLGTVDSSGCRTPVRYGNNVKGIIIPHATKLGGYIGFTLSVCPSVRLSVCLLTFRVHPVASTVQDGFFPYLAQMINIMRGCVACDDPSPWPISSRSFGLDLENRVRSVASTVLDGLFLYARL